MRIPLLSCKQFKNKENKSSASGFHGQMHRWYVDALSNSVCELPKISISLSQTSWQQKLFLANASIIMHQSKRSSQWCRNGRFTKLSIILQWNCSKVPPVWGLEDYPVCVGVADKQGLQGLLCKSACKQYLCQNCTRGRKRALQFSALTDAMETKQMSKDHCWYLTDSNTRP